ncbi:uncharacterized protein MONBRDRAFT_22751 [Monosiga brevicollis MX1]|uniref:Uncharacterized protein n=1 Tax=Monosiga brevicollis TaxID=81824 RepID=A9URZ0_MONBE|nr:uncharacterized protein MONBRDRAFT_22751 [Monosiga brevicollis MX1]EDQ92010.1 predicted protein [Monosiga brevicollis MX1]|eukprot:XP_001743296.1 hypothetical protein [Monosiga brevicollis MX1]
MSSSPGIAWVVDVTPLKVAAPRPSATVPEHHHAAQHQHAAERRSAYLHKRAQAALLQNRRVAEAAEHQEQRRQDLLDHYEMAVRDARSRRQQWLMERQEHSAQHFSHVLSVQKRAEDLEQEHRIRAARSHLAKMQRLRADSGPSSLNNSINGGSLLDHARLTEAASPASKPPVSARRLRQLTRAWRLRTRTAASVRAFAATPAGQLFERAGNYSAPASFEEVASALHERQSMERCIPLVKKLSRSLDNQQSVAGIPLKRLHRVFLTCLMITMRPDEIFDDVDEDAAEELADRARSLVEAVLTWMHHVQERAPSAETKPAFATAKMVWLNYLHAFRRWSQHDRQDLVQGLVQHHEELCRLRETVAKRESIQSGEWHPHIDQQLVHIEDRLQSLKATEAFEQCSAARCELQAQQHQRQLQERARDRTVSGEPLLSDSSPEPEASDPLPPDFKDLWDVSVLHRIAVDPDFRFTVDEPTPGPESKVEGAAPSPAPQDMGRDFEARARHQARRAIRDVVRAELEAMTQKAEPHPCSCTLATLVQLRDDLAASTLPRQTKLRHQIEQALDVDLLHQQLQHGALDEAAVRETVLRFARMLSAPMREPMCDALARQSDLADFLLDACELTKCMRIDLANFIVDAYRPLLRQHAIMAEKERVDAMDQRGELTLPMTKAWLSEAPSQEDAAAQPHAPALNRRGNASFETLFYAGFEALLRDRPAPERWPETLQMDAPAVLEALDNYDTLLVIATLYTLLVAKNAFLKEDAAFAKLFKDRAVVLLRGEAEKWAKAADVVHHVPSWHQASHQVEERAVQVAHLSTIDRQHPVAQLLLRRAGDELRRHFNAMPDLDAIEMKQNTGLDIVHDDLSRTFTQLARIAYHNKEVFAGVYDRILDEVYPKEAEYLSESDENA